MEKNLEYLLTSEFDEGLKPEELIDLLKKFRFEYRVLHSRTRSLEHQIDKLNIENENLKGHLFEIDTNYLTKIAKIEDKVDLLKTVLNKKLTLKERVFGKVDRKLID